jgi:hypothetical protein
MHFLIHFLSFPWITAEKRRGNTVLNAYPRGYALKAAFPGISGETIDKVE